MKAPLCDQCFPEIPLTSDERDRAEATADSLQAAVRLQLVASRMRAAVVADPKQIPALVDEANQCLQVVLLNAEDSLVGRERWRSRHAAEPCTTDQGVNPARESGGLIGCETTPAGAGPAPCPNNIIGLKYATGELG